MDPANEDGTVVVDADGGGGEGRSTLTEEEKCAIAGGYWMVGYDGRLGCWEKPGGYDFIRL